ncbi:MAG: hypothetical protein ABI042_13260 [Verrucomicrobiota bacterium]
MMHMWKNILLFALISFSLAACGKKSSSETEATLPELDRALQSVTMAKGKLPEKVEELSEFMALQGKRLPIPPSGKRYVIDRTNRKVVLVSQ